MTMNTKKEESKSILIFRGTDKPLTRVMHQVVGKFTGESEGEPSGELAIRFDYTPIIKLKNKDSEYEDFIVFPWEYLIEQATQALKNSEKKEIKK